MPDDLAISLWCGKCRLDPHRFVKEGFLWGKGELEGWDGPDAWQAETLATIGEEVRKRDFNGVHAVDPIRMATASGHGIGKTALTAWIILWIASTRPRSKGVVTANTSSQLETKTWAELAKWKKRCATGHWFNLTTGKMSMRLSHKGDPEGWRCDALTCREENSRSLRWPACGRQHAYYFFDEASAVPDVIYDVAEGGMTDGEPMQFVWGNPTRNIGRFREIVRQVPASLDHPPDRQPRCEAAEQGQDRRVGQGLRRGQRLRSRSCQRRLSASRHVCNSSVQRPGG